MNHVNAYPDDSCLLALFSNGMQTFIWQILEEEKKSYLLGSKVETLQTFQLPPWGLVQ